MFSKRVTMILASLCCLSTGQAQTIAQPVITQPIVKLEIPRTTVIQRPTNSTTQLPAITPSSTGTAPMPGAGSISDRLRLGRGGMDGGGGNAVVCRDNDGRVTRAKLLDLFEGEALDDLVPQKFDESLSFEDIAKLVAKNIDRGGGGNNISSVSTITNSSGVVIERSTGVMPPRNSYSILSWVQFVIKEFKVLPEEVGLEPIPDSGHFIFPRNCKIEQVAVYKDDSDRIFFVGDIWEAMDKTHKAALIVHEALYKNLRSPSEPNSDRTRKAVALAFSGLQFRPLLDGVPEGDMTICNSTDENMIQRFVLRPHPSSQQHMILQFVMFNGLVPLSRTYHVLNASLTSDINSASPRAETEVDQDDLSTTAVYAFDMTENILNKKMNLFWKIKFEKGKRSYFLAAPGKNAVTEEDYQEIKCRNGGFQTLPDGTVRGW